MEQNEPISVEAFLTRVAANFEGTKSRPPSVAALLKKISKYKDFGLSEADIPERIRPKPKFSDEQRAAAVKGYASRLSQAGLNQSEFEDTLRDLKIDSFEGLLRAAELRKILGSYIGSPTMTSKDDGISRLRKRFEDRLAA